MNDPLQSRLDRLVIELKDRRKKCRDSLRNVILCCVLLLLFFILYSALISCRIREIAAPANFAFLFAGRSGERIAGKEIPDRLNSGRAAEEMSRTFVLSLPLAIQAGGELLRDWMKQDARYAAFEISQQLADFLHRKIDRIVGLPAEKIDIPEFVRALPAERSGSPIGMSGAGRTLMFPVPLSFGDQLREIRLKSESALTRQDLCARNFMLCWLFLNEHERYRDTRHVKSLMEFSRVFAACWAEVSAESVSGLQKNTKKRPVPNKIPARQ